MAYTEGTDTRSNIWGMQLDPTGEFYYLPDPEPGLLDQLGGGGGGGMSFRMAPTSGFGPINLGGGLMDPAQALHEFNLERNKYTPDSPFYKEQAIFSGEKPAQDAYKAAVAAGTNWDKPRGYTADELARYTANAKAHTDTQGTIMKWSSAPQVNNTIWSGPGFTGSTAAAQRANAIARASGGGGSIGSQVARRSAGSSAAAAQRAAAIARARGHHG